MTLVRLAVLFGIMVKWTFDTYEIVEADSKFAKDWDPYSILGLKDDKTFATEIISKAYNKFNKRIRAKVANEGESAELDFKGSHGSLAFKTLTDP